jgi:hypothetical protein
MDSLAVFQLQQLAYVFDTQGKLQLLLFRAGLFSDSKMQEIEMWCSQIKRN